MSKDQEERRHAEAVLRGEEPVDFEPKTVIVPMTPGAEVIAQRYEADGWKVIRVDPKACGDA